MFRKNQVKIYNSPISEVSQSYRRSKPNNTDYKQCSVSVVSNVAWVPESCQVLLVFRMFIGHSIRISSGRYIFVCDLSDIKKPIFSSIVGDLLFNILMRKITIFILLNSSKVAFVVSFVLACLLLRAYFNVSTLFDKQGVTIV